MNKFDEIDKETIMDLLRSAINSLQNDDIKNFEESILLITMFINYDYCRIDGEIN
jgi:hypothetical protein